MTEYEFLGANDDWKQSWAKQVKRHYWLFVFPGGCGSFGFEARALFVNRIAGVRSVHGARMRGDIDTPAGYLAGVRLY